MLETPHVAVGAAIATAIPNPFISIPLAFASHFILDKVPHWNPHSYTEIQRFGKISVNTKAIALVDVALALTTGFFIAFQALPSANHFTTIILASFASVLPDVSKSPYFLFGVRDGILKKWVDFERSLQVETTFKIGMIVQILVIAASLWWVFSK
jgi:hypothetical protein